jgi:cytochrome c peroxidase
VPQTIGALWFFFTDYRSSSVQAFLTGSKKSSDLSHDRITCQPSTKDIAAISGNHKARSHLEKQRNISHQLKIFLHDVALGEGQCLFVPSVASMDRQIFVNGCSRRAIPYVVAMLGLYSSLVSLEVSAQSTLAAGGELPAMPIPADNPQSDAKIELGRQLYFDGRLSANNEISCATCHDPKTGWAGHDATDTGVGGRVGNRNSGTIVNSGYMKYQFWDGRAGSLEEQALGPIHNPVEMGETLENVVRKLNAIPGYKRQFHDLFHSDVTTDGIAKAIAAFERTIVSGPSPYDRFLQGDKNALTVEAKHGMEIFNGKGRCAACHTGPVFSDQSFHNLGIGMNAAKPDVGREAVTKDPKDRGKFKTPGLRNVANTYPYMHDGQTPTLEAVVELHNKGGIPNSDLDPLIKPLGLTDTEKKELVAFLKALTGPEPLVSGPKPP